VKRLNLSLLIFILVCFFMPWVQLSCVGMKDSLSGFDFARRSDTILWLIPTFMLISIVVHLFRSASEKSPALVTLIAFVGGGITAYLMYRERASMDASVLLVAAYWTPLYWLGFIASIILATEAIWSYSKKALPP
jgi:hypothetical protein